MSNIQVNGDAHMKATAFGDENQIVSDVGPVGGHLIQALLHSDVHIGNKPPSFQTRIFAYLFL